MRIAVVGLGVIGASVARALARAGAAVTVYERVAPVAGTSATTFAWVNSHHKNPRTYHDLNAAGMTEHLALADDPGPHPPWFFPTGNLEWASDADAAVRLDDTVAQLASRDYPARWISPDSARSLVPDLRLPSAVREVAFYPTEGYVLPPLLVARLWGEARDHGALLRCPAEVTGIEDRGRGVRVDLSDDEPAYADALVLAAGRWTEALSARAGQRIPMADPGLPGSATVGLLGCTTPVPSRLNRVLTTPRLNVRPDGGGRLVLQGLDLDADADPARPPAPTGGHADQLCARLGDVLSGVEGVRLESLGVGQRAMPADGLTVAGFLGDSSRIYAVATHSGITLGPLLGKLVAKELITDRVVEQLTGFRPQRLAGSATEGLAPLRPPRSAGEQ